MASLTFGCYVANAEATDGFFPQEPLSPQSPLSRLLLGLFLSLISVSVSVSVISYRIDTLSIPFRMSIKRLWASSSTMCYRALRWPPVWLPSRP